MTENTTVETVAGKTPVLIPIRCSVCGRPLLNVYPNTIPGVIFATCREGHKTSYRAGESARKAV